MIIELAFIECFGARGARLEHLTLTEMLHRWVIFFPHWEDEESMAERLKGFVDSLQSGTEAELRLDLGSVLFFASFFLHFLILTSP